MLPSPTKLTQAQKASPSSSGAADGEQEAGFVVVGGGVLVIRTRTPRIPSKINYTSSKRKSVASSSCYEHDYEDVQLLLSLRTKRIKEDHSSSSTYDGCHHLEDEHQHTKKNLTTSSNTTTNSNAPSLTTNTGGSSVKTAENQSFLSEKVSRKKACWRQQAEALSSSKTINFSSSALSSSPSSSYSVCEQPEIVPSIITKENNEKHNNLDKKSLRALPSTSNEQEKPIDHHHQNSSSNISSKKYVHSSITRELDSPSRRTYIGNKDSACDHQAPVVTGRKGRDHRAPRSGATAGVDQYQAQNNFNGDVFLQHCKDFPAPLTTTRRTPPAPVPHVVGTHSSTRVFVGANPIRISRGGVMLQQRTKQDYLSKKAEAIISATRSEKASDKLWWRNFLKLQQFHAQNGHCNVPARYAPDKKLGNWVMTQRHQFQLLKDGKASTLVYDRIDALSSLKFTYSLKTENDQLWYKRFEELKEFKAVHGHCVVPQRFPENKQLGLWVNTQRSHYNLYQKGQTRTCMTLSRIKLLESVNFAWSSRGTKSKKEKT